jgi:hypothetical protein
MLHAAHRNVRHTAKDMLCGATPLTCFGTLRIECAAHVGLLDLPKQDVTIAPHSMSYAVNVPNDPPCAQQPS